MFLENLSMTPCKQNNKDFLNNIALDFSLTKLILFQLWRCDYYHDCGQPITAVIKHTPPAVKKKILIFFYFNYWKNYKSQNKREITPASVLTIKRQQLWLQ